MGTNEPNSNVSRLLDVRASYDAAAEVYAEHLFNELDHKPFDRLLLDRFAEAVSGRGLVADLGCGPGHVAKYLHERGVTVCGIDLSPEMVRCAARRSPGIDFRVGDIRALDIPPAALAGIVAFYSIVHFAPTELESVFRECRRVLAPGGVMLLSFHAGDQIVHVDDLWGRQVSLDFQFHEPRAVITALSSAGFVVTASTERAPYPNVEYQSRRCYIRARATDGVSDEARTVS